MIVVDTNVIAALYLPAVESETVKSVQNRDPYWVAPRLWRSEFRNLLAQCLHQARVTFREAVQLANAAEWLMSDATVDTSSYDVLRLAEESGCSAYDCEFVATARQLDTRLITCDQAVQRAFPEVAIAPHRYIGPT